jgi:tetratricopeptide (TPR) repeat protein
MTDLNCSVLAWAETVVIPTYRTGPPDKNPMFLEKRVYQGSSGAVYPHPVIDHIEDEKVEREYTALFLENGYLKIMILPEIGGRVQMALDKTNGYDFVYYNRVIKPALVGLAGPWISGGIEFNWPQHHRPSTFDPLDWRIVENADGSRTIWCSEIERMYRTRGMHGFTLYPERAYLEVQVQLYNRTSEPQTFLWWANPAVHVHDDYESVFPPDVHAVMDHGKRDVSDFPIATGVYYKVNYFPGTDISRYKNIPVPTSFMAYHSNYNFIGDYDHRAQAGMLHIANHHIVPGKKQWTWGNGDFGQAWDRQLTDEDGPYIELMCGAYTDNQPDFSWIQPGEEKCFTQIFMPYQQIGPAKNASKEAVVNLEMEGQRARIGAYLTCERTVTVRLTHKSQVLFEKTLPLSPAHPLIETVQIQARTKSQELQLSVLDGTTVLISFTPPPDEKHPIPSPALPARPPHEIASNEELFLNGLHLEQYRHATWTPESYYQEALRRDPLDSRCNNALGLLLYRRGKFAEAELYFRRAIRRLTQRNPNPYDGEPYYNLGLSLKMQGRYAEAYDAFFKAVWNAAWQDAACFELARLACRDGRPGEALALLEKSLERNARHHKARHLKIALLRRQGECQAAQEEARRSLEYDPLEYGALWEMHLLDGKDHFSRLTRGDAPTRIEIALDYSHAGLWQEAADLLQHTPISDPLVAYTLGWLHTQAGALQAACHAFRLAAALPPDYCFPNRLEDVLSLQAAQRANPQDGWAAYYLGNFWYAHRQYDQAIACWEQARHLLPNFPTVRRNLGLAYYNQRGDAQQALSNLQTAFELDTSDARLLFELDQLHKMLNWPAQERLAHLEKYPQQVAQRDDLTLERVTLLNLLGKPEEAFAILANRNFHPWEGGEGKVTGQYVISLVEIARRRIEAHRYPEAIQTLEQAQYYPPNLGEGKLYGAQENNISYYLGFAYQGLGEKEKAATCFERAAVGLSEPTSAMYYNDQPPDMIFYQGLARRKLGREEDAQCIFGKLIDYGLAHMEDEVQIDYFAVSLPDFLIFEQDLSRRNRLHCHYMAALGYLGSGNLEAAEQHFAQMLTLDSSHLGAVIHKNIPKDLLTE